MRIDAHVHCDPEDGYVDRLLEEEHRLGFDKVCLNGALWTPGPEDANDYVEKAMQKYPEEIIGFAYLPLGSEGRGGGAGVSRPRVQGTEDDPPAPPLRRQALLPRL